MLFGTVFKLLKMLFHLDHMGTYCNGVFYVVSQDRSTVIATYALCGFSNVGSIGIMIGSLGAMAPSRKKDITKVVVRAMIAGNVACFMTACIAGILFSTKSQF